MPLAEKRGVILSEVWYPNGYQAQSKDLQLSLWGALDTNYNRA